MQQNLTWLEKIKYSTKHLIYIVYRIWNSIWFSDGRIARITETRSWIFNQVWIGSYLFTNRQPSSCMRKIKIVIMGKEGRGTAPSQFRQISCICWSKSTWLWNFNCLFSEPLQIFFNASRTFQTTFPEVNIWMNIKLIICE